MSKRHALYDTLKEDEHQIRLLVIKPSQNFDSKVECSMRIFPLRSAPSYCALSYVWGDKKVAKKVVINDIELRVGVNLVDALLQLRAFWANKQLKDGSVGTKRKRKELETTDDPPTDIPLHIWADAICINQKNLTERASQVKIMGEIFRTAAMDILDKLWAI